MREEEYSSNAKIELEANEPHENEDCSVNVISSETQPTSTMSKNQMKKLKRQAAKLEQRVAKRQLERQRRKESRKRAKESGELIPIERKKLRYVSKEPCNIRVVIDTSYDEYMTDDEVKKLVKQIQHCYAINRRAVTPFLYSVTSFTDKTKKRLESLEGSSSWNIEYATESYDKVYNKEDIVFLSAESGETLTTLEENKVYVIGGLVDHNRYKGLCHKQATDRNITTAKLPISEYIDMKSRKVLTVDHVFEILIRFHELKNWEEAFFKVIPKRKGYESRTGCSVNRTQNSFLTNQPISVPKPAYQALSHSEPANPTQPTSDLTNQITSTLKSTNEKIAESELSNQEDTICEPYDYRPDTQSTNHKQVKSEQINHKQLNSE